MGLDMYLSKRTYVKNWNHTPKDKQYKITVKRNAGHEIKTERITEISEQIMYWRKANHIHKFFIDNCADGVDECQAIYIDRSILADLVSALTIVLHHKDEETSAKHLPTESGFFFGGTQFDEYYYEECSKTLEVIENLLRDEQDGDIYYRASW
jgi:hypothetical protein